MSRIDLDSLTDELGLSLLIMRTNGQVPTWAVVEIDEAVIESKQVPLPRFGEDRFVQLTSTSKQRSNLGIYVAVPVYDIFGAIYTSTLEIDSIFKECMVRGDLDRRLLQLLMDSRLTNSMRRTLGYDSSVFFPNNFLELTIFEKRRIYEKLEGVVVLDERGRNVVTRAQIIPGAK